MVWKRRSAQWRQARAWGGIAWARARSRGTRMARRPSVAASSFSDAASAHSEGRGKTLLRRFLDASEMLPGHFLGSAWEVGGPEAAQHSSGCTPHRFSAQRWHRRLRRRCRWKPRWQSDWRTRCFRVSSRRIFRVAENACRGAWPMRRGEKLGGPRVVMARACCVLPLLARTPVGVRRVISSLVYQTPARPIHRDQLIAEPVYCMQRRSACWSSY